MNRHNGFGQLTQQLPYVAALYSTSCSSEVLRASDNTSITTLKTDGLATLQSGENDDFTPFLNIRATHLVETTTSTKQSPESTEESHRNIKAQTAHMVAATPRHTSTHSKHCDLKALDKPMLR